MGKAGSFWGCLLIISLAVVILHAGEQIEGTKETEWRVNRGEDVVEIAKRTRWGRPETLIDHFHRHGADFGAKSARDYAKMASDFFVRAQKEKLPTKIAPDGTIRLYDRKTNTFGAYNPDGTTKTFFKPKNGGKYWNRQ